MDTVPRKSLESSPRRSSPRVAAWLKLLDSAVNLDLRGARLRPPISLQGLRVKPAPGRPASQE